MQLIVVSVIRVASNMKVKAFRMDQINCALNQCIDINTT